MAYTVVPTKSTGDLWTAADHNTYIKDNFAAGVPDIFTTKGDIAVATAANTAARLAVGSDNQVLLSDSGETSGVKWGDFPSGSTTLHARYYVSGATSCANATATIIDFDTQDYDTDSAVTTGGSWKLTVPADHAGKYLITATVRMASAAWLHDEYIQMKLYKNNAYAYLMGMTTATDNQTVVLSVTGFAIIDLAATDYIDVRIEQNTGGAVNTDSDGDYCHVAIARLFS